MKLTNSIFLEGQGQNHSYEEVMLLPPKQFRDAPSPVSSIDNKSNVEEAGAVDNILYHIYESPRKNGQLKKATQGRNTIK